MEMDEDTKNDLKKHVRKTGTTTVGIVCKDGIVLAADTRGTFGGQGGVSYIASNNEQKVQQVTDNMVVTTAGVASDLQKVIKLTRAELKLKQLKTKKDPTIKEAANLFSSLVYQNIRQFSTILALTHFLLSGYDEKGFYLYEINPDGYLQEIEGYSATGSGMIQVNPILDSEYTKNLSLEDGIKLAIKCINTSMKRDPATGEGLDVYTVTKEGIKHELKQKIVSEFKDR